MKNIRFTNLEMRNFKKHSEFNISFDGMTLIVGRNGSGKSSIFEAVYTCLYNRRPNGKPSKTAIKKGTDNCYLKLNFEVGNDLYEIERIISTKSNKIVMKQNGNLLSDTSSKVKEMVDSLIPPDILKLSMFMDVDIKNMFLSILDFDFLDKLVLKASKIKEEVMLLKKELDHKQEVLSLEERYLADYYEKLTDLYNVIEEKKRDLESLYNHISHYDINEVERIFAFKKNLDIDKYVERIVQDLKNELNNIETEISLLNDKINTLRNQISNNINVLHQQEHIIKSDLENQKIKLYNSKEYISNTISDLEKKLRELKSHLVDDKVCPTCGQDLPEEKVEELHRKIQHDIELITTELNKNQEELQKIENEIQQFNEYEIEQLRNLEKYKIDIEVSNQEIEKEIRDLEDTIKLLTNKKAEILQKIENNISSLSLDDLLQKILLEEHIDYELYENVESIKQQFDLYKDEYNKLQMMIDQYNSISKEAEKIRERVNDIKMQLSRLEKELKEKEEKAEILSQMTNIRLWKKAGVRLITSILNNFKEDSILDIEFDLDQNENLVIKVTNLNGEQVLFEDLSQGETVLAKLSIYEMIRNLVVRDTNIRILFLDEVVDRLDKENIEVVLNALRGKLFVKYDSINIITHNTFAKDIDIWDNVIELS